MCQIHIVCMSLKAENTHLLCKGNFTLRLTSCFTGLDSAAWLMVNQIQIYKFGRIQPSQTGGQRYSDTSPYEVDAEVALVEHLAVVRLSLLQRVRVRLRVLHAEVIDARYL